MNVTNLISVCFLLVAVKQLDVSQKRLEIDMDNAKAQQTGVDNVTVP